MKIRELVEKMYQCKEDYFLSGDEYYKEQAEAYRRRLLELVAEEMANDK